jgi:autotransporter passenger strand-loop-strand repeat protein
VTDYVVSVGQFTSNLGRADTATIEDTGSSVRIVDGGTEIVFGGGLALGTTVLDGVLTLSSGGGASGALVSSGGLETVSSGGVTSAETIIASGSSVVLSGGVASGVTISSGGVEQLSGGAAYNVQVVAGGHLDGSGTLFGADDYGTVSGATVGSSLDVLAGGVAEAITVSGLADPGSYYHQGLFVSSGASATGAIVGAEGYLQLDGTGSATNTTVRTGGDVAGDGGVLEGVTSNAGVISSLTVSGALIDLSGGYDSGNVIAARASDVLSAGGSAYNDTVDRGAVLSGGGVVYSLDDLGTVSGVSVGSSLDVSSGGVAEGITVSGLADPGSYYHEGLFVSSGAATTGAVVGSKGYLQLGGTGSAANTVVKSGGDVAGAGGGVLDAVTSNAGVVSGVTVSGALIDLAGGYDSGNVIAAGASDVLSVGGSAYNDTVDRGAVLSGGGVVYSLDDLGTVSGVSVGSSLDVSSGGVAESITVSGLANPGAYYHEGLFVSSGASAIDPIVGSAGYLELDGNGSATGAVVKAGGVVVANTASGVLAGVTSNAGVVSNAIVHGTLIDLAGGYDNTDTLAAGSVELLDVGAVTNRLTIDSAAVLSGGGVVSSAEVFGSAVSVVVGSSLDVEAGGVALDIRDSGLSNPGAYYHEGVFVSSGASATGTTIGLGGYLELDGTGSAAGTTVGSGGVLNGAGGGFLRGGTTNSGTVENLTVLGTLTDVVGAYDDNDTVAAGASDIVEAGGSANNVTVSDGGQLYGGGVVSSGNIYGLISNVRVGSSLDIQSGGVADAVTISGLADAGDYYHQGLFVHAGGQASGAVVGSSGYLELDGTGSAAGTAVAAGGVVAGDGGVLVGRTTNAGVVSNVTVEGAITDAAGGYEFDDTIASGAVETLLAGGSAAGATIEHGGEIVGGGVIYSADDLGTVSGVLVGSSLEVLSGGVAAGVVVSGLANPGSYYHQGIFIASGAAAAGAIVGPAGYLELDGGVAAATTVSSNGVFYDGALADGATVLSGGLLSGPGAADGLIVASSGATIDLAAVLAGGVDDYYAGAHESLTVSSGGVLALAGQVISAGETLQIGLVTATELVSGVTVLSGATVELAATLVETGETLELAVGAILSGVTLQSGAVIGGPGLLEGRIIAAPGAMLSGARLASGSELTLSGGAAASSLTIGRGAVVSGPGLLTGRTADSGEIGGALIGGELAIAAGGELSGASLLPGAEVSIASGGGLRGVIQLAGPVTLAIQQGATISAESVNEFYSSPPQSLTLAGGDTLALTDGVIAAGAVYTAGKQVSAAIVDKVTLDPGAALTLTAPTVLAGGTLDVRSGASVSGAVVNSGGEIVVSSGGVIVAPTVNGGVVFELGATLAGTLSGAGSVIESGGVLAIRSAAAFRGEVVISSGEVELAGAGGAGSGSVDFAAGAARLVVEAVDTPVAGRTFASELLNFSQDGDSVLLAGLADAGGSATAIAHGDKLVLTDGGKTYDFSLGGQIAPSFVVTSADGGTLITANPPLATQARRLAQSMATFGSANSAPATGIGSSHGALISALIAQPHPAMRDR